MKPEYRRWWDLPAALLLFLALLASAGRLVATGWAPGLEAAVAAAALGALLGMALGYSRFRLPLVSLLALGYTIVVFPWTLGVTQYNDITWEDRIASLGERLSGSLNTFFSQLPVEDALLFIVLVSLAYWLISLTAGYLLVRQAGFLPAILPAGIALLIVQSFDTWGQRRVVYLIVYLLASLLLLARLNYIKQRAYWKEAHIYLPSEAAHNLNLAILFTTVLMVGMAWLVPAPAQAVDFAKKIWNRVSEGWQSGKEDLGNVIAGLEESGAANVYFGDTLPMSQEAVTGDTALFTVQLPPADLVPRYYWRVRVYDLYADGEWETLSTSSQDLLPEGPPLELPYASGREVSKYTFTIHSPISLLFTPPRPVWISLPVHAGLIAVPDERSDPIFFQSVTLPAGDSYQVQAVDLSPSEQELRAAGTNYPQWVVDRSLQLPDKLPVSIRTLALDLTKDAATPYDKALAITDYLRREIRYNQELPPVPANRDVLEWFLFDYKQGFCNYYATAEVILLRAASVPARLAVGYAEGEIPPGTVRTRLVRKEHAHAWPEVYFPGIGWIEFEPTASQPPLNRPAGEAREGGAIPGRRTPTPPSEEPAGEAGIPPEKPGGEAAWLQRIPAWQAALLLTALAAIAVGGYLTWMRRKRPAASATNSLPVRLMATVEKSGLTPPRWLVNWARWTTLTPIERSFAEVYRSLRRLGVRAPVSQTPAEAAAALTARLPEARAEIISLLEAYQPVVYGCAAAEAAPARLAAASIRRKSRKLAWKNRLSTLRRAFIIRE
jgi:transglutaminase-like putative cysteine protease